MKYRADIDGLRGIAVISVVAFHFFPYKIKGGFIGVDIFFVISGFLISSILFTSLDRGNFSIVDFYDRRIRRIFPSLITVVLASLVFGWFLLLSDEYQQLGKHVVGGASFISNFILSSENGYFGGAAESKPLLHLWSLAIEEQFYIFWPLLLWLAHKRKWNFLPIMIVIGIGSFVGNIYMVDSNPTVAFYWPIYRFWELTIGGILAGITLYRPQVLSKHINVQSLIGFGLLVIGFITINKFRQFPGWWALLPTLGAFLLLAAGPTAWINRSILSNKILVWFGLISYPLYLWHWPLISFARILEGGIDGKLNLKISLLLASVLLGWLTYRFIEKPLRFKSNKKTSLLLLFGLLLTGLLGYSCIATNGYNGLGFRIKEKTVFANHFENLAPALNYYKREGIREKYREQCNFYNLGMDDAGIPTRVPLPSIAKECYVRSPNVENSVFIWGDSHAAHLYHGISQNLSKSWQVLQVTSSGCYPEISSKQDSSTDYCKRSNWFAMQTIAKERPDTVIVAQNNEHNVEKMSSIRSTIESLGVKNIIFTGPTVHWQRELPKVILRDLWQNTPQRTIVGVDNQVVQENQALKNDFKVSASSQFVSVIDYFCNKEGCLTHIGKDRKLGITSFDYGHLTPIASDAFARDVLVPSIIKQKNDSKILIEQNIYVSKQ
jgi:peptidoglycan/LPS O-acetylase OafA/YrhL